MAVSCVIITLDESAQIEDCIKSVIDIVDEIIIIDAESSDNTIEKAEALGAKVFVKTWEGYGQARNYGAEQAQHNWILSIDADERISPELADSIKSLQLENNNIYAFNRLTNYCGQWIKHGAWFPEWKARLYHHKQSSWSLNAVHETLMNTSNNKIKKLKGELLHYAYSSHEELETRLSLYANLLTKERLEKGIHSTWIKRNLSPMFHFIKSYIFKLGFLDGLAGYKIAIAIKDYTRLKYRS